MILEVAYPNAIRCGMTKHEFFHSTMKDVNIRIRDYQEKEENRVKELEYVAWMNGLYIRAAVASAFSKKAQYPENPLEQNKVEDLSQHSIKDFGMSELTTKGISSRFQAMGSAMGFAQDKMADMSIRLTELTADMASFYNVEQKDVAEDLESIFTGQTRPLSLIAA